MIYEAEFVPEDPQEDRIWVMTDEGLTEPEVDDDAEDDTPQG